MKIFFNLAHSFYSILSNFKFIFIVTSVVLCVKTFIFGVLISKGLHKNKINVTWILILLVLISSIISDLAWVVKLSQILFFPLMDYRIVLFVLRIAWGFYVIQYQALALFLEKLLDRNNSIRLIQKIFLFISNIMLLFIFFIAFYDFNCIEPAKRLPIESIILTKISFFLLFLLMPLSIIFALWKMRSKNLPRILKKQVKILIAFFILPILISDIIQFFPGFTVTTIANYYFVVGTSTLFITFAIFHCIRKIMGLRFLNLQNHVMAKKRFVFIKDFKNIIDQFSQATDLKELKLITQYFFQEAFKIPSRKVYLHIRSENKADWSDVSDDRTKIEKFISQYCVKSGNSKLSNNSKVIIADEVEFSNFYENKKDQEAIIEFMNEISADIFIPIFEGGIVSAYIIVDKHARVIDKRSLEQDETFYSDVERDQMTVFANYLANVIKHLRSKDFNVLLKREKELKEELYLKHQEVAQYKESIDSFLVNANQEKVGTIFYKNRRFTFGNQCAQELIPINLNRYSGHPTTKKLKKLAEQALEYGSARFCSLEDAQGNKLVASGILYLDKNSVIISVYYPEVSDILRKKLELVKDPTKFDYLLYLETTKSGKLIDKLIPGNSETLLNFKIDLLKVALSKKAIFLDLPEQDLVPTVEILHHISLRENLHILDVKKPSKDSQLAIKLFGISKIFGMQKNDEKPLLEKLDKIGTLFIKNIDNLELETQKYLAEFLKFGFFRQFKSDKKTVSDVRVICSANTDLKVAVENGRFCLELFNELRRKSVSMPSLMTLPDKDFYIVTEELTKQAVKTNELQHVFELTDKEKRKLAESKPVSFFELKNKIKQILEKKSHQNKVVEEVQFISLHEAETSDPQVVEAARLGKYALRDKNIMCMLWNKFQNQNKIANLLGVNRSSVNRRCKEYNLI